MPWELIEERVRATHPYSVFTVRSMLSVPYFEKRLYELPEEEVGTRGQGLILPQGCGKGVGEEVGMC